LLAKAVQSLILYSVFILTMNGQRMAHLSFPHFPVWLFQRLRTGNEGMRATGVTRGGNGKNRLRRQRTGVFAAL